MRCPPQAPDASSSSGATRIIKNASFVGLPVGSPFASFFSPERRRRVIRKQAISLLNQLLSNLNRIQG
ncbi:hypothetical protein IH785_18155, partial [candidate division KSB1 bacterium]|nr:hypothetical protein [candidate division KSB1 bacterium]